MGFSRQEKKLIHRIKNKKSKLGNAMLDWANAKDSLRNKKKARRKKLRAMRTRNGN